MSLRVFKYLECRHHAASQIFEGGCVPRWAFLARMLSDEPIRDRSLRPEQPKPVRRWTCSR